MKSNSAATHAQFGSNAKKSKEYEAATAIPHRMLDGSAKFPCSNDRLVCRSITHIQIQLNTGIRSNQESCGEILRLSGGNRFRRLDVWKAMPDANPRWMASVSAMRIQYTAGGRSSINHSQLD